jgi:hypothetical protein
MKPVPSIRLLVRSDKHSLTKTSRQHITWSQPAKKIKAIKKLFFFFWVVILSVPLFQGMNKTSDSTALYIAPAPVDWRVHPTL